MKIFQTHDIGDGFHDAITEVEMVCPHCGEELVWHHHSGGISRSVCRKKCKGWEVINLIDRTGRT